MKNAQNLLFEKISLVEEQTNSLKQLASKMFLETSAASDVSVGNTSESALHNLRVNSFGDRLNTTENGVRSTWFHVAEALLNQRQSLTLKLGAEFVADPVWTMLLDLLVSEAADRKVSVTSLTIASGVPATTALRWIASMEDAGLIERSPDPSDQRRTFLSLTDRGASIVETEVASLVDFLNTFQSSDCQDHLAISL